MTIAQIVHDNEVWFLFKYIGRYVDLSAETLWLY